MELGLIFMDFSLTLEMAIYVCTKIKSLSGTVNVKWKILVFGFSFKQKGNYDKFLLISE